MGNLKWYDSPHWNKKNREPVIIEEPPISEFPAVMTQLTARQIEDAIKDDPRYNGANPSNQQHIINMAVAHARNSGMLIEDKEI